MPSSLTNRIALVTGASRGIGAAIAIGLAGAGADIAVNYRERAAEAGSVVAAIRALGRRAFAVGADVSDAAAVAGMMRQVEADFDRTIAINLKSAFLCTQAVLPAMRARGWGRIVNISSGAARGAGGVGVHYNASKAGMEGLTRGYAARLIKQGITVNAVAPSLIETDMVRGGVASSPARIPMGRFGTPEECAQAVLMVIGNAYLTGQTVQLNGGMSFI